MSINRFSRGPIPADVQSEFIPLPIDLIDRQIQRRQSSYDMTKEFMGMTQESLYGAQALQPDREALTRIVSQYDTDIEQALGEVGGDYSRLRGFADSLGTRIKRDLTQGHLGAIHNNFVKAQGYMQELDERKKKGDIRESGYQKGLASIRAFQGTQETGDGGYSSPDLYVPTKYLEIGKVADDYGAKIRDQYDAEGRRFIRGSQAAQLINENLWNNPQVLENAREELWGMYGDLDPETEHVLLNAYIGKLAKDAGYKLQFQQTFKPTGEDSLTGNQTYMMHMTSAKPHGNLVSLDGTGFVDLTEQAKKTSRMGKLIGYLQYAFEGVLDVPRPQVDKAGNITYTRAKERATSRMDKANEAATEIVQELAKQDIVRDLAEINNIDLTNPNLNTFRDLESAIEGLNSSTANTGIGVSLTKGSRDLFKEFIDRGTIQNLRVEDVNTGRELTHDEKAEIWRSHINSGGDGEGALLLSGEVVGVGQPYPYGTLIANFNDPGGNAVTLAIDSNQNKGSREYVQDRIFAAYESGASRYTLPGGVNVQFLRMPDGTVRQYVNGELMRDEEGNIIVHRPTD